MSSLFRSSRLRRRILTWSFFPTAIILLVVAIVAVYAYGRVTEQQALQQNRELARLSAVNLSGEISQFSLDLNALTRQVDVATGTPEKRQAALKVLADRLAEFDAGVVILDAQGQFVASWPERPESLGRQWSTHPYFAALLRSSRPVFSDVIPDGPGGATTIVVAVAISGQQGEFNGVLAGMFRLGATSVSALYGNVAKLRVGVSGDVYVVDGKGVVIQHPDTSLIGTNLISQPMVQEVVAGNTGAVRALDTNKRDVVAGYSPVPGTNWGLVAVESWSVLMRPVQGYRMLLFVLLGLSLIVPALVVFFGVRRVTRPVLALTHAAREVAAGNFEHPVTVTTGDELQELAEQFNEMSVQLRDSYSRLDQRVADRTRELATLNAVAAVVSQSLELERILDDALQRIMEDLGFGAGGAFIPKEGSGKLEPVVSRGLSPEALDAISVLSEKEWSHWLQESEGRSVTLEVSGVSPSRLSTVLSADDWHSVVQVPLTAKGRTLGILTLCSESALDLTDEKLGPLEAIGNQIGMAVENARLYGTAEESATAAERNRLARDLHDAVSQTLFSASLIAEVLPRIYERDPEQGRGRLEELRELTRGALAEMRMLLLELRPAALAEANLKDLLRQLGEALMGRSRIPVELNLDECGPIPMEARLVFYRISQEALHNVAKHSGANHAWVSLTCGEAGLQLVVEDNGVGFEPASVAGGRLGLGIMSERAEAIGASLQVNSAPGSGTRIQVNWEVPASPEPPGLLGQEREALRK